MNSELQDFLIMLWRALLLFSAAAASVFLILGRRRPGQRPRLDDELALRQGLVELSLLVESSARRSVSRDKLAQRLRKLCANLVAMRSGADADSLYRIMQSGTWTDSEGLRSLLKEDFLASRDRGFRKDSGEPEFVERLEAALEELEVYKKGNNGGSN